MQEFNPFIGEKMSSSVGTFTCTLKSCLVSHFRDVLGDELLNVRLFLRDIRVEEGMFEELLIEYFLKQ